MRFAFCAIALLSFPAVFAQTRVATPAATRPPIALHIPRSVQHEHDEIHAALAEAAKATDKVRAAAADLGAVLHPHLVREEQIALPLLGLLAGLSTGHSLKITESADALTMADSLRREMPRMLEEHKRIKAAVQALKAAARADGSARYEQLADRLTLHAQTEEDVLYPAAILAGDVVRGRMPQK
jgi:iron-sulfur cluster repair protein YtfE (RIC family)